MTNTGYNMGYLFEYEASGFDFSFQVSTMEIYDSCFFSDFVPVLKKIHLEHLNK